jgi:citrate/tricarballylate utilization protein
MSLDLSVETATGEARRQIEICNACRYCEGFCAVFPAMTRQKAFADGDLTHLANLCHNCRGCYYSCQYTEPHEFALNIPAALAEVRQDSWERLLGPAVLTRRFHESGVAITAVAVLSIAVVIFLLASLPKAGGDGFYSYMSHNAMVALFLPAFILPLLVVGLGISRYWREVGAGRIGMIDLLDAARSAARLKNLSGGQGQGCNFERQERYSDARRYCHQALMWGFLLCFAATSMGTMLHYFLDWPAPYPLLSPPKLFGVPGGLLMVGGAFGLAWLKTRSDPSLGSPRVWGGEMAFTLLLAFIAITGLALYAATGTRAVPPLLALHLGSVLTLFLLLPYTKMVHAFFRLAALAAEEGTKRRGHVSTSNPEL